MAAGSEANAKNPSLLVTERRTPFDASLMTVTSAPGMTPPDSSTTLPLIEPVMLCADVVPGSASSATRRERATSVIAFAVPELWFNFIWLPCLQKLRESPDALLSSSRMAQVRDPTATGAPVCGGCKEVSRENDGCES